MEPEVFDASLPDSSPERMHQPSLTFYFFAIILEDKAFSLFDGNAHEHPANHFSHRDISSFTRFRYRDVDDSSSHVDIFPLKMSNLTLTHSLMTRHQ